MKQPVYIFPSALLFVCLLFAGCDQTPLPEEIVEEPVFSVGGFIGEKSVSLKGGVDDYYMYASYVYDDRGYYTYVGEFRRTDCMDCKEKLRVIIRDAVAREEGNPVSPQEAIPLGAHEYVRTIPQSRMFQVDFTSRIEGGEPPFHYSWSFGDESVTEGEENAMHMYSDSTDDTFWVCLDVTEANSGCSSRICNEVYLHKRTCQSNFGVSHSDFNPQSITFETDGYVNAEPPLTYHWDFGEGISMTTPLPAVLYGFDEPGIHMVGLRINDAQGCESMLYKNIRIGSTSDCMVSFTANVTEVESVFDTLQLSRVIVEWTDKQGVFYSSQLGVQPEESFFTINAIEPYRANERGDATARLDIDFDCVLYSDAEDLRIRQAQASIAVAHP